MDRQTSHTRATEAFLAACELEELQREPYLARACAGDAELLATVRSLLARDAAPAAAIDRPALGSSPGRLFEEGDAPDEPIPHRLGRFAIRGVLGRGGMGVVYLAEQESPRREVALKVMRAGLPSATALRRFENEGQVLSRLQHPGIAQIHEAGVAETPAGRRPYFAMELVRGKPLLAFAAERNLTIRQRVALMADIADAVQHAHAKGVIHRDLKPGNILVDEQGRPKVLDFGVARDIEAASSLTESGQVIGTLAYMSPEQVGDDPHAVDVRSDVYSLGVVAYELLTGRTPIDVTGKGLASAARAVSEESPVAPRTLNAALRGDIEAVLLKAMEKNPERRYRTASELGDEFGRIVRDETVMARRPGVAVRVRRFVRENKALTTALVAVIVVSLALAGRGQEARVAAKRDRSAQLALEFLSEAMGSADLEATSGQEVTVVKAILSAADTIPTHFADDPVGEGVARNVVGRTLTNRGRLDDAEPHLVRAVGLLGEHSGPNAPRTLNAMRDLASLRYEQGRYTEAAELYERVLRGAVKKNGPNSREALLAVHDRTLLRVEFEPFESVEEEFRGIVARMERLLGPDDPYTLAATYSLAEAVSQQGRFDEAAEIHRRVLNARLASRGERDLDTLRSMNALGAALSSGGHTAEAVRWLERCLALRSDILGDDHSATLATAMNLGATYARERDPERAEPMLRMVAEAERRTLPPGHPDALLSSHNHAHVMRELGRFEEAEPIAARIVAEATAASPTPRELGIFIMGHGICLTRLSRFDEAETKLLEAYRTLQAEFGDDFPHTVKARAALADLNERWGRPDEAAGWQAPPGSR